MKRIIASCFALYFGAASSALAAARDDDMPHLIERPAAGPLLTGTDFATVVSASANDSPVFVGEAAPTRLYSTNSHRLRHLSPAVRVGPDAQ